MGILSFLTGPWGALIEKALLVISVAGLIYIGVSQYNDHIAKAQMLRDQNAQLIQLQKDNQQLQKNLDVIRQINGDILIKLNNQNQKVVETHDKVTTYIQSPDGQKSNRPASDVIKNTIGMLRNEG